MPRKGLDEPGNFNRTCGFMGLCRQRHKPGHPAGEIEGSWAIDKESGEKTAAPSTNGGSSKHCCWPQALLLAIRELSVCTYVRTPLIVAL